LGDTINVKHWQEKGKKESEHGLIAVGAQMNRRMTGKESLKGIVHGGILLSLGVPKTRREITEDSKPRSSVLSVLEMQLPHPSYFGCTHVWKRLKKKDKELKASSSQPEGSHIYEREPALRVL